MMRPSSLQWAGRICSLAELTIHAVDGRAHGFRNLFDVASGHLQLRVPELGLNVAWFAVFLEVGCAGPPERLVGHVFYARLPRQRLQISLQVVAQAERPSSLVW